MNLLRTVTYIILTALALSAGGCFTGVDSTPRIKESDVRRQRAVYTTEEQSFLNDITPIPPAQWQTGRAWLVANDRISLIFTPSSDNTDNLKGHRIYYDGMSTVTGLTGEDAAEISFRSDDGRRLRYRVPSLTQVRIDTMARLDIPFAVDLDIVARLDSAMRGQCYWVRTPSWYDAGSREPTHGLRHIEVIIDSVAPGDENFPAAVFFSVGDPKLAREAGVGRSFMVYMSVGQSKASTRNFDTLFSFENPRKKYPEISDDAWELIIHSRVRTGMTRDESRLALGAPANVERVPTLAGMLERWFYSDGVYLIFEDGMVSRFRL